MPYFEELDRSKYISNQHYLTDMISLLHDQEFDFSDNNSPIRHLDRLPDGTMTVKEASEKGLKYTLSINDNRYWQYHRNNGVTKLGVLNNDKGNETLNNTKETIYMIRSLEGQIQAADMINKAYIHELFNDTYIVSGIQFMPFKASLDVEVERIINIIGLAVFPACMAIALPVFLYNLVLEKETKLLEMMKINGMKMKYYWLINFLFFLGIFLVTTVVFWTSAAFGFKLNFFITTDWRLLASIYLGWGLCQVALAFFLSVFINNS